VRQLIEKYAPRGIRLYAPEVAFEDALRVSRLTDIELGFSWVLNLWVIKSLLGRLQSLSFVLVY
jgi:hypothetical protein